MPFRTGELVAGAVECHVSDAEPRIRLDGEHPRHGADPCKELLHIEGLGEIVVRAAVKPGHPVIDLCFRSEEQDGGAVTFRAHPSEHLDPVELRHHHVEDHAVVVFRGKIIQSGFPVVNNINGIIAFRENGGDGPCKGFLVFRV